MCDTAVPTIVCSIWVPARIMFPCVRITPSHAKCSKQIKTDSNYYATPHPDLLFEFHQANNCNGTNVGKFK